MLTLRNKGFHEFVLTVLSWSLFNTWIDLLYSAFVSELFIFKDSLILCSCMLGDLASIFGWSQLNRPWQSWMFSCTWSFTFFCHAIFLVFDWLGDQNFSLILQCISLSFKVLFLFLVLQMISMVVWRCCCDVVFVFSVLGALCLFSLIIEFK